jgi:hypothetical protein
VSVSTNDLCAVPCRPTLYGSILEHPTAINHHSARCTVLDHDAPKRPDYVLAIERRQDIVRQNHPAVWLNNDKQKLPPI